MKLMIATLALCVLAACSGPLPLSQVDGPVVPDGAEVTPLNLQVLAGKLSAGTSGTNAPITENNLGEVVERMTFMFSKMWQQAQDYDKGPGTTEPFIRSFGDDNAAMKGRFKGELTGSDYTFSGIFTAALRNMTVDSEQYFGGGLEFEITHRNNVNAYDAFSKEATIDGELELGGVFRGTLSFRDFHIASSAWVSSTSGELLVHSNGSVSRFRVEKTCANEYGGDCDWVIEPL